MRVDVVKPVCAVYLAISLALAAAPKELRFCMAGDPKTFDPLRSLRAIPKWSAS